MPYPGLPFCHPAVKVVGCFASRVGDFVVRVTQIGPFGTLAGFQLPSAEMEGERERETRRDRHREPFPPYIMI